MGINYIYIYMVHRGYMGMISSIFDKWGNMFGGPHNKD